MLVSQTQPPVVAQLMGRGVRSGTGLAGRQGAPGKGLQAVLQPKDSDMHDMEMDIPIIDQFGDNLQSCELPAVAPPREPGPPQQRC